VRDRALIERALDFEAEHTVVRPHPHRHRVVHERDAGEVDSLLHFERIALGYANLCTGRQRSS